MSSSPLPRDASTIRYRTQSRAPHLQVDLEGHISGPAVRRRFATLPDALSSLPAHFVAMVDYRDVILFHAAAISPLFYYITHLFDAGPGFCVFVEGEQTPHPGLRTFIERVGRKDQTAFVASRADGLERIQAYAGA